MNDDRRYPRYVLGVLVVVYVLNFLDRQISPSSRERARFRLRPVRRPAIAGR